MKEQEESLFDKIQHEHSNKVSKEQLNSSFTSFNFTKYNVPSFKETPDKQWVKSGVDNIYPQYLVDRLNKSATHNAIITMKAKQVYGEGITIEDSEDKDQQAAILSFFKKTNRYGESLNDILKKIIFDQQVFGYFCLGITWSNDRSEIASIYHIDASNIRVGKPNENGEVEGYWYSENWRRYTTPKYSPKFISKFDTGNRIDPNQLLFVRKYRPDTKYYGLPDYVSALNAIELEYELSNYQLNSVKQGFAPSMLVSLNNGDATDEQREVIWRTLNSLYKGSDNAGRFMLTFAPDAAHAPSVTPINANNLNELYTTMAEFVQEQIIVGHRLTSPTLAGIKTPGELGSSNELEQASELFFTQVIGPEQLEIEETINKILHINGFSLKAYIKDLQPLSYQISEDTMLQVMTLDEIRKKLGLQPLSQESRDEIYTRNNISVTVKDN